MIDVRPVAHVIGLVIVALGGAMAFPMALDWYAGSANWMAFLQAGLICLVAGGATVGAGALAGVPAQIGMGLLTAVTLIVALITRVNPLWLIALGGVVGVLIL